MKGIIFVNHFGVPLNCVNQAKRLKEEFDILGVETKIEYDGFSKYNIDGSGKLNAEFNCDFAVFFDKDKYLSKAVENSGVRLFNCHNAIRLCDDKGETYLTLSNSGIKMPKTYFAPLSYHNDKTINKDLLKKIGDELSYPLIVKESYGSMGSGVHLIESFEDLLNITQKLKNQPFIIQEYIGYKFGTDCRVILIGGKVVASMIRSNEHDFRSNLALGGKGEPYNLPEEFKNTAEKCAEILQLDYCGVDILFGENDIPIVCEVNSNAFFAGIESITKINVAKKYAKYIINEMSK